MTTLVIGLSPSRHSAALATAAALADREDSQLCSKFDQLCSSLNVDFSLRTDASSQFKSVRRQYALEGEPHHWLACALALAQRRVSHRSSSLLVHHLLSAASMSIPQYLRKMRKWIEMALATVGTRSSVATTISVKPPPLADATAEPRALSSVPSPDEGMAEPTSLAGSQSLLPPSEGRRESVEPATATLDSKEGILPLPANNSLSFSEPSEPIAAPRKLSAAAARAIAEEQRRLLQQLDRVEASFSVCSILYQKFDLIFRHLFRDPQVQLDRGAESNVGAQQSVDGEPSLKRSRTADAQASEQDSHLCSPLELYEFLWLFFLFVRSRFLAVPEDLVNSYHLLLCILDHIYACVYVSRRIDLLNPTFEGLPPDYSRRGSLGSGQEASQDLFNVPSVLHLLCDKFLGSLIEVKTIREHSLKPLLLELLSVGTLISSFSLGNSSEDIALLGLLDPLVFAKNRASILSRYLDFVRAECIIDERIFVQQIVSSDPTARIQACSLLGVQLDTVPENEITSTSGGAPQNVSSGEKCSHVPQSTSVAPVVLQRGSQGSNLLTSHPLIITRIPPPRSSEPPTTRYPQVTDASRAVSELLQLVAGRKCNQPAPLLKSLLLENCSREVMPTMRKVLEESRKSFLDWVRQEMGAAPAARAVSASSFTICKPAGRLFMIAHPSSFVAPAERLTTELRCAEKRALLAEALYWKFLENILLDERRRFALRFPRLSNDSTSSSSSSGDEADTTAQPKHRGDRFDCSTLLMVESFHRSLFACTLDLVLYSYGTAPSCTFPWVLDLFQLPSYIFMRVIEPIVRSEAGLARSQLKYFKFVEECTLEAYAWRSESPLWAAFEAAGDRVPPAPEDVCLPSNLIDLQCLAGAYCPPGGGPTHGVPPFGFRPPPHLGRGALSQKRHTAIPMSPLASASRARPPAALTFAADETASATARLETILSERAEDVPPRQQQSSTARRALFQDTVEHQVELPFAQGKTVEEENSAKGAGEAATVEMEPSPTSQPVLQPEQKTEATRDETDSATPSLARRSASRQSTSFSIFIRKVYYLANVRLRELAERFGWVPEQVLRCWSLMVLCIRYSTVQLLRDRHLDQLLLCAIHAIARSSHQPLTFRQIIGHYRQLPNARSHVYRSVFISCNQRANIVVFYNEVFVKRLGSAIERLTHVSLPTVFASCHPCSPAAVSLLHSLPALRGYVAPPRKLSQRQEVYVASPLKGVAAFGAFGTIGPGGSFITHPRCMNETELSTLLNSSSGGTTFNGKRLLLNIQRSPAKDFTGVNRHISRTEEKRQAALRRIVLHNRQQAEMRAMQLEENEMSLRGALEVARCAPLVETQPLAVAQQLIIKTNSTNVIVTQHPTMNKPPTAHPTPQPPFPLSNNKPFLLSGPQRTSLCTNNTSVSAPPIALPPSLQLEAVIAPNSPIKRIVRVPATPPQSAVKSSAHIIEPSSEPSSTPSKP